MFSSDLPSVNPATLNEMILYCHLLTKWSGLGDSTKLSRIGLSQGMRLTSPRTNWWWWHGRGRLRRAAAARPRRRAHGSPNSGEARGNVDQRAAVGATQ
jgi:hypothetical protein